MHEVAVVRYEEPLESLRKAVEMVDELAGVACDSKVFIKPNLSTWREADFPRYGVITTVTLIEDIVLLLKERGVEGITIIEGPIEAEIRPESLLQLIARGTGLDVFAQRHGVRLIDVHKGSFARVSVNGTTLSMNRDILDADCVINMPALKTHSQAVVSLGMKNLKGLLNIPSRKKCHGTSSHMDLNYHLAGLPDVLAPALTIIDGIYSLERGPLITGRAYRSNIIVASRDVVSADKVGATVLGIDPETVPHIALAAGNRGRPLDLSDVDVKGEVDIKTALQPHAWEFEQNASGDLPMFFERAGIRGITYPQADATMCTYCADFIYYVIWGILSAKNREKPFDDIEILHGKSLPPAEGHRHTLLVGECQVRKNGDNPSIDHCVRIRGCPPSRTGLVAAYSELGIELPDDFLEWMRTSSETYLKRYAGKPEFDESFYRVRQRDSESSTA